MTTTSHDAAIARFLRTLSSAAVELARALEAKEQPEALLDRLDLGPLQRSIVDVLATGDPSTGLSPRAVAKTLERGDEPNIRTTLQRLEVRGIAERLEGVTHQRWRLAPPYLPNISA